MNERIEGTIRLDGLIEGRLPPEGDVADKLREWTRFVAELGLKFSVEVDGNAFSVLADARPVPVAKLEPDPAQSIKEALDQLLLVFPAQQRTSIFSTLRASEYSPGKEIQSVFAVGPDGQIAIRERTVDVDTHTPEAPLTIKERVKLGLIGLCVAVAVLAVTSFFVDYRGLWESVRSSSQPINTETTQTESGAFADYLRVVKIEPRTIGGSRYLVLTLERLEAYPLGDEALQEAYAAAGDDLQKRLAIEALARGYLTVEQYSKEQDCIGHDRVRIAPLRTHKKLEVAVPFSKGARPVRLRLVY